MELVPGATLQVKCIAIDSVKIVQEIDVPLDVVRFDRFFQ